MGDDIIAFGKHTRSNNVGRGMPSLPLDNKHDRTTSGVSCHHRLWKAHTVERRRAWLNITALGLHARLDDVGRGMTSPPLDCAHARPKCITKKAERQWQACRVRTLLTERAVPKAQAHCWCAAPGPFRLGPVWSTRLEFNMSTFQEQI
uniref:Uncharacterized protein n=1 Tax=Solanum lycopersicum TaxID=4081 RepID=A0A3Q7HJM8_SOLLC